MVAIAKQVTEKRDRESYGRYFEDFEVGHVYEHGAGRTIAETDKI
jgi:itaconyl-CoA hydratase